MGLSIRTSLSWMILLMLLIPAMDLPNLVRPAAAQQASSIQVTVSGYSFFVPYSISGGSISSVSSDPAMPSLLFNVSPAATGTLTIQIPRNLLDAKAQGSTADDDFIVFIDDVPNTDFNQISTNLQYRTLTIPFDQTAQTIEVVGTIMPPAAGSGTDSTTGGPVVRTTPEFGASMLTSIVLAGAILGVIGASARYGRIGFHTRI